MELVRGLEKIVIVAASAVMISCGQPPAAFALFPTKTPTATATYAPTPTATSTFTPTATFTPTYTPTPIQPTATATPTSTPTDTPAPTATYTPRPTRVPTNTPVPIPTNTPMPKQASDISNKIIEFSIQNSSIKARVSDISVPVLMYHYISSADSASGITITSKQFDAQMQWLLDNNYDITTLDELLDFMQKGNIRNPYSVVPIFDDNYRSNVVNYIIPWMRKFEEKGLKHRATLSVITAGVKDKKNNYSYSWEELAEWEKQGYVDVQSHTVFHPLNPPLASLSDEKIDFELRESKKIIDEKLNKNSIAIIWPGGSNDTRTRKVALNIGYKILVGVVELKGMKFGDSPEYIYRVKMHGTHSLEYTTERFVRYSTQREKLLK